MTQIILKSKTGEIAIMTLVSGEIEDAVKKFQDSHPEFTSYSVGEYALPENREFRDAWTIQNNKIVIDNKKAMRIHLERVREKRNEMLEELDREQLKTLAVPGMAVEIDMKKQVLRDLPDKITNLEWPEIL